jgi:hypothetical protein
VESEFEEIEAHRPATCRRKRQPPGTQ